MKQDPFWSVAPCHPDKPCVRLIPSLACSPLACPKPIHLTEMARQ